MSDLYTEHRLDTLQADRDELDDELGRVRCRLDEVIERLAELCIRYREGALNMVNALCDEAEAAYPRAFAAQRKADETRRDGRHHANNP